LSIAYFASFLATFMRIAPSLAVSSISEWIQSENGHFER
jgi:hypothetical protein